jgi:tRNA(Ile)-lysidine synthase
LAHRRLAGRRISLPGGWIARYEQEHLILRKDREGAAVRDTQPTVLAVPGRASFAGQEIEARVLPRAEVEAAQIAGDKSRSIEYFDLDRVKLPVIVRTRRAGDRFQPLGMATEKKVGKFLTTTKVSRDLREQVLIFADRERIIWVCPVRISEPVKVTESTRRILALTVHSA